MSAKKSAKPKVTPEDINEFIKQSQYSKNSPKVKKTQKRLRSEPLEEDEDMSRLIGQYQASAKKKKIDTKAEEGKESRMKILDLVNRQSEARKNCNNNLLKNLNEITNQVEADYNAMKDNEQKLEHLTNTYMKCIQQVTTSYKHKLKMLREVQVDYKKDVEGLLLRGAMKPDDRPLWFDVYKAFPPAEEPKSARPKPEIKPFKQILYKEDVIRAKFHSQNHGLAAINLLSSSNDTQIKRLVQQYETLKSEGIPEDELVEKSVTSVGVERRESIENKKIEKEKTTSPLNTSVSQQVLSEANLKNIFEEK